MTFNIKAHLHEFHNIMQYHGSIKLNIFGRCTNINICSFPSCIRAGAGVNVAPDEKTFVLPPILKQPNFLETVLESMSLGHINCETCIGIKRPMDQQLHVYDDDLL